MVAYFQVLKVVPAPEAQHIDAPHSHHAQVIRITYKVSMAKVQHGVPGDGTSVFVNTIWSHTT